MESLDNVGLRPRFTSHITERGEFMENFAAPYSDNQMIYSKEKRRYILTEEFVRERGIDLGLELDADAAPEPSKVPELALDRISLLVYSNIYNYGRQRADKEYLLACQPELREIIRDAMLERLKYMIDSGDLSTRSGALITQGTRIETKDLIPSVTEEMILRPTGLLHRGKFSFIKDLSLDY